MPISHVQPHIVLLLCVDALFSANHRDTQSVSIATKRDRYPQAKLLSIARQLLYEIHTRHGYVTDTKFDSR
jgi:hypothetical protein